MITYSDATLLTLERPAFFSIARELRPYTVGVSETDRDLSVPADVWLDGPQGYQALQEAAQYCGLRDPPGGKLSIVLSASHRLMSPLDPDLGLQLYVIRQVSESRARLLRPGPRRIGPPLFRRRPRPQLIHRDLEGQCPRPAHPYFRWPGRETYRGPGSPAGCERHRARTI